MPRRRRQMEGTRINVKENRRRHNWILTREQAGRQPRTERQVFVFLSDAPVEIQRLPPKPHKPLLVQLTPRC